QPSGFSIAYTYDFDEIRKRYYMRKQDSAGRVEERWYDQEGVLLEVRVDGLLVQKTTESAQGYNRIRQRQFVGGRTLTQTYNQNGKLIKVVRNDGSYESAEYAGPYQKISSHRAANGKLSSFEYDDKGNLIRMTEAVGTALQRVVEFAYDQYGQRIRINYPADALTQAASYEIEYDNHGNANKLTAPLNSVQQLDYNVTGRVIRSVSAGNGSGSNVTQLEYDQAGSLLSITDPLNRVYRAVYDAAGQRTQVTAPNGRVVRYSYDANGRSTGVAAYAGDNKLTSMSYQYDELERKLSVSDALGYTESRSFDALGQLLQYKNRAGEVVEYQYNQGILQTLKLPDVSRSFQYDLVGNPVKETLSWSDNNSNTATDANQIIRTRVYNEQGKAIAATDGNGNTRQQEYDLLGRAVRMTDALGGVTQLTYDSRNNLLTLTDAEGRTTRFTYDALNRKTSEQRSPLAGTVNTRRYFYNDAGYLAQEVTTQGNVKQYSYDKAGQRIRTRYYAADDLAGVSADNNGRYSSESLQAITAEREVIFTYNNMGQLTELNEPGFRQ